MLPSPSLKLEFREGWSNLPKGHTMAKPSSGPKVVFLPLSVLLYMLSVIMTVLFALFPKQELRHKTWTFKWTYGSNGMEYGKLRQPTRILNALVVHHNHTTEHQLPGNVYFIKQYVDDVNFWYSKSNFYLLFTKNRLYYILFFPVFMQFQSLNLV